MMSLVERLALSYPMGHAPRKASVSARCYGADVLVEGTSSQLPRRALRTASPKDEASLVDLFDCCLSPGSTNESDVQPSSFATSSLRELLCDGEFIVHDAEGEGLAGAVFVQTEGNAGRFAMLAVAPSYRGHGLGRRLLTVAEMLCESRGCQRITIRLDRRSDDGAVGLTGYFLELGYRLLAERRGDDALVLEKLL